MILVSAGHNPKQVGACFGDYCEYEVANSWTDEVLKRLKLYNVEALKVPTGGLTSKVNFINAQKNAKIAVEIHFNSDGSKKAKGSETLFCPGSKSGEDLAKLIQSKFVEKNIFQPNRGQKPGWYKMDKPGHVDYKGDIEGDEKVDYFLAKTKPIAVIIEPEFIYRRLDIESNMSVGCDAIAEALVEFYNKL